MRAGKGQGGIRIAKQYVVLTCSESEPREAEGEGGVQDEIPPRASLSSIMPYSAKSYC